MVYQSRVDSINEYVIQYVVPVQAWDSKKNNGQSIGGDLNFIGTFWVNDNDLTATEPWEYW